MRIAGTFFSCICFSSKTDPKSKSNITDTDQGNLQFNCSKEYKKEDDIESLDEGMQRKNHMKMKDDFSVNKLGRSGTIRREYT